MRAIRFANFSDVIVVVGGADSRPNVVVISSHFYTANKKIGDITDITDITHRTGEMTGGFEHVFVFFLLSFLRIERFESAG